MMGVLSWLIRWSRCSGTKNVYPALAASAHYNIFFSHHTLSQFLCPHRPATWAASRAGPPVYNYNRDYCYILFMFTYT
jgi:hypothetical protein